MLYHLLYEWLQPHFGPLNVVRYITVRTAFASLTALLLMLVLGPWMIRRLRAFQVGQFVREEIHHVRRFAGIGFRGQRQHHQEQQRQPILRELHQFPRLREPGQQLREHPDEQQRHQI